MAAATFTVYFPGGEAVPYAEASLFSLAKTLIAQDFPLKNRPLLIRDEETGTKLYYNEHSLQRYLDGKMPLKELLDGSWCHGLYRNKTDLKTQDGDCIDAHSLWLLRDNELILLNADEFHTGDINTAPELFYQIA